MQGARCLQHQSWTLRGMTGVRACIPYYARQHGTLALQRSPTDTAGHPLLTRSRCTLLSQVVYRRQHLEKLYGPEGAEAMEAILAIGRKPAGRPGKAKAADLSAVLALPDEVARPGSASAEEQQEEGQKQQAGQ